MQHTRSLGSPSASLGAYQWVQKSTPPNTWLRLRDFKAGPLVEEYRTAGPYLAHVGYSTDLHWIRLTPFGEQFYRENWQQYRDLYPEVTAPTPGE